MSKMRTGMLTPNPIPTLAPVDSPLSELFVGELLELGAVLVVLVVEVEVVAVAVVAVVVIEEVVIGEVVVAVVVTEVEDRSWEIVRSCHTDTISP